MLSTCRVGVAGKMGAMMLGLPNVARSIIRKIWKKTHSSVEYARRIGVNFGEELHIYMGMFVGARSLGLSLSGGTVT